MVSNNPRVRSGYLFILDMTCDFWFVAISYLSWFTVVHLCPQTASPACSTSLSNCCHWCARDTALPASTKTGHPRNPAAKHGRAWNILEDSTFQTSGNEMNWNELFCRQSDGDATSMSWYTSGWITLLKNHGSVCQKAASAAEQTLWMFLVPNCSTHKRLDTVAKVWERWRREKEIQTPMKTPKSTSWLPKSRHSLIDCSTWAATDTKRR